MTSSSTPSSSSSSVGSHGILTGILIGSSATLLVTLAVRHMTNSKRNDKDGIAKGFNSNNQYGTQQQPQQQQIIQSLQIPSELRDEQLSRHHLYFGSENMERISKMRVLVVGLGGVGSHCCTSLARSGIGFMRMVDFDQVTLSSLNRHACATLDDVGSPKATCLHNFLSRICPSNHVQIESINEMYTSDTGDRIMQLPDGEQWDMVIDAIDDIPTKAVLIRDCFRRNVRVISCMGAGCKSDFTRLHLSDLRNASRDPLASKLRLQMKYTMADDNYGNDNDNDNDRSKTNTSSIAYSYLDDMERLTVLWSSEVPVMSIADFTDEQHAEHADATADGGYHDYGAVDGMRIRIIPVLGPIPAIFGQALATTCLSILGKKPFQPITCDRVGRNVLNKTIQRYKRREELIKKRVLKEAGLGQVPTATTGQGGGDGEAAGGAIVNGVYIGGPLLIDMDDVEYLMLSVWRNRCAMTNNRLGTTLSLTRWDESKPGTVDNLVLMSLHALTKFDDSGGKDTVPQPIQRRIEQRLASCRVER